MTFKDPYHVRWPWLTLNTSRSLSAIAEFLVTARRCPCCRRVSGVRPSVMLVHCIVSTRLKISSNFFLGPVDSSFLQQGRKIHGGRENLRFSIESAVYRKRCETGYVTLIGNHRWRIDVCRFRWPWVTHNPGFKVRIFFDIEYIRNDTP